MAAKQQGGTLKSKSTRSTVWPDKPPCRREQSDFTNHVDEGVSHECSRHTQGCRVFPRRVKCVASQKCQAVNHQGLFSSQYLCDRVGHQPRGNEWYQPWVIWKETRGNSLGGQRNPTIWRLSVKQDALSLIKEWSISIKLISKSYGYCYVFAKQLITQLLALSFLKVLIT